MNKADLINKQLEAIAQSISALIDVIDYETDAQRNHRDAVDDVDPKERLRTEHRIFYLNDAMDILDSALQSIGTAEGQIRLAEENGLK